MRSASIIEGVTTPELVKEQIRLSASQAEEAAQAVDVTDPTMAVRMRDTAEDLSALASEVGRSQLTAPAGSLPDLAESKRRVQADVDIVAGMCAGADAPVVFHLGW